MSSLINIILDYSYIGVFLVIFAETGLLLGFFLPGDSLLITAGIFAADGRLGLWPLILAAAVAAILGNLSGYFIGKRFGPAVFNQRSKFFKPEYVREAHEFFEKYGWQSVILARFVPIVRTVIPTMAGVSGMPLGIFTLYTVLGGLLWGVGLPALAYFFGRLIPDLDKYILLIVAVVLLVSFLPIIIKFWQSRRRA